MSRYRQAEIGFSRRGDEHPLTIKKTPARLETATLKAYALDPAVWRLEPNYEESVSYFSKQLKKEGSMLVAAAGS